MTTERYQQLLMFSCSIRPRTVTIRYGSNSHRCAFCVRSAECASFCDSAISYAFSNNLVAFQSRFRVTSPESNHSHQMFRSSAVSTWSRSLGAFRRTAVRPWSSLTSMRYSFSQLHHSSLFGGLMKPGGLAISLIRTSAFWKHTECWTDCHGESFYAQTWCTMQWIMLHKFNSYHFTTGKDAPLWLS